ncbi:MAG: carboxylesterase/lipase family protein [Micrococcaceae bacterium]
MDISNLKKYRVQTSEGLVQGQEYKGIGVWKGIRYATPPIANLRFQNPQAPQQYEGVFQAINFGTISPQKKSIFNSESEYIEASNEDCLFVNIWSPAADDKKRPVMVWIHGGAYATGSSSDTLFDGYSLAKNGDVVLVNFNYRMSAFGYLHFGILAEEQGIEGFDNNLGLKDQVAALQWIKANIAAFGGDPDNITIFGESAGGASVTSLLATPVADGLFHRAIAESPCVNAINLQQRAKRYALDTLYMLGLEPEEMEELKAIPAENIVNASHYVCEKNLVAEPGSFVFACVIDSFLPVHPIRAVLDAQVSKNVPLMIGTNSDESSVFGFGKPPLLPVKEKLQNQLFDRIGPLYKDNITSTYKGYPKKEALFDLATDWAFTMPTFWFAENYSLTRPSWVYEFQYASPFLKLTGFGAAHTSEIPYIFHSWHSNHAKIINSLSTRASIEYMGQKMQDTWLRFVKTGNPNPTEAIEKAESDVIKADESYNRVKRQSDSETLNLKQPDFMTSLGENLVSSVTNIAWFARTSEESDQKKEADTDKSLWHSLPTFPESLPSIQDSLASLPKREDLTLPSLDDALSYAKSSLKNLSIPNVKGLIGAQEHVEEKINEKASWVPWPQYTTDRRAVKVFNLEDYIAIDPGKESRLAWNSILRTIWQRNKNQNINS